MGEKLFAGSKSAFQRASEARGIFSSKVPKMSPTKVEASAAGVVLRAIPSPEHWNRSLGPESPARKPGRKVRAQLTANLRKAKRGRKKAASRGTAHAKKGLASLPDGFLRNIASANGPKAAQARAVLAKRKGGSYSGVGTYSSAGAGPKERPRPKKARKARKAAHKGRKARRLDPKTGSRHAREHAGYLAAQRHASAASKPRSGGARNQTAARMFAARRKASAAVRRAVKAETASQQLPKIAIDRLVARRLRDAEENALLAQYGGRAANGSAAAEAALAAKYG